MAKIKGIDDFNREYILQKLGEVTECNIGELIAFDNTGEPYLDYSKLDAEMRKAITSVDVDVYLEGRGSKARAVKKVRVRAADKLKALDQMARILGLYVTKVNLTDEDSLIKRLEEGRKVIAKTLVEENDDE